jgi:dGTPase
VASPSGFGRDDRLQREPPKQFEYRSAGQRDRDRILYSSAFRRLGGVTQVVSANEESHLLHNRLTHSIKVAQIARRLAERLAVEQSKVVAQIGGVDPDVVEAAALAHDLGHPPFGHVGEKALDEAASNYLPDGFEGNAQSFRIITKISLRNTEYVGLNLSRATLDAVLKYPWFRTRKGTSHSKKWSAYETEAPEFAFARTGWPSGDERKCPEAEIMDWADDIAYSIHDVEDFYRMGLIPLDKLARDEFALDERREFFDRVHQRHQEKGIDLGASQKELEKAAAVAFNLMPEIQYEVSVRSRTTLRSFTSNTIARYVDSFRLRVPAKSSDSFVRIRKAVSREVAMMKELTWNYVIHSPALATQQVGFQRIVTRLFELLFSAAAARKENLNVFPPLFREALRKLRREHKRGGRRRGGESTTDYEASIARIILDVISSMTENQALRMFGRLEGTDPGSILDPLYY